MDDWQPILTSYDGFLVARSNGRAYEYRNFGDEREFWNFYKNLESSKHYYEVIHGEQKPYFDIDIKVKDFKGDPENLIKNLIDSINKILGESEIIIYNSNGIKKLSYHVLVLDKYVRTYRENKNICLSIIDGMDEEFQEYMDSSVYTSTRLFRMVNSEKEGSLRMKRLGEKETTKFKDFCRSLVTYIDGDATLIEDQDRVSIPLFSPDQMDKELVDKAIEILESTYYNSFSLKEIKGSLILLKRNRPTFCDVCSRVHENEHPYLIYKRNGDLLFNCRRNEDSFYIGNILENDDEIVKVPIEDEPIEPDPLTKEEEEYIEFLRFLKEKNINISTSKRYPI